MNSIRPDILKELELSPLWRLRSALAEDSLPASLPPTASGGDIVNIVTNRDDIDQMNWQALRAAAESCRRCGLCEQRNKVAFGAGAANARLMLIGEGPGAEEDKQGQPFVGAAGQLLDLMLTTIEQKRHENVYIANIVKCRPPGNRNPTVQEAQTCLPFLHRQIALVRPRLLVALGRIAAQYLLQTETSISQLRQKIYDYRGIPLTVTYHPAYLLRSPLEKRKSWEDLRFIRRLLADKD